MSRINTALAIIKQLAKSPATLRRVIDANHEEDTRRYVTTKYGFARGLPTINLLELMPEQQETIAPYSFLEGQATPPDLILLKALARQRADCRYLEIGTWRGESLANVASVAGECVSLTLSEAEMRQFGLSDEFIESEGFFTHDLSNVRSIKHNSQTFDFATLGEGFDLVFVDGDHSRESVTIDTRNVFKVLRNEAAVIVWHDYAYTPEAVRWDVLAAILDGAPKEAHPHLYHVSNTMCAVYIKGEFEKKYPPRFGLPDKVFTLSLTVDRLDQ